jgi:transglutaminase-like putative cysteine protease
MPALTIKHITTYQYRQPVAFGEHRMMLRPRDSHDQSLIDASLVITPTPASVRRTRDAFGNHLDIARFSARAKVLRFESTIRLDHVHADIHDRDIAAFARTYPFSYGAEAMPVLGPFVERRSADPNGRVGRWARTFLRADRPTNTLELLIDLTHGIKRTFKHVRRDEKGIQAPLQTLVLGSGSCRDLAMLMIDAARSLGMAARFVSGYCTSPMTMKATGRAATGMAVIPMGAIPMAAIRMLGLKSICPDPAGSISIRPAASSAIATSFVSRWCAIRARRFRSMAPGRGFRPTISE